jgi:Kef-type K+ transport system membrane component KefB
MQPEDAVAEPGADRPRTVLSTRRTLLGYGLLVVLPLAATVVIVTLAPHSAGPRHRLGHGADTTFQMFMALAVVTAGAAAAGYAARRLGQPPVVGELTFGVLLGPSALGAVAPGVEHWLLPHSVLPLLSALGQLGVVLFMFTVGLGLSVPALRRNGLACSGLLAHAGVAVPFLGGVALALGVPHAYRPHHVSTVPFLLFFGLCLCVTAVPVLARLLSEEGLLRTRLGTLAMAAAGLADVTVWCLLVAVLAVADSATVLGGTLTVAGTAVFSVGVWLLVRPLLSRVLVSSHATTARAATVVLVTVLLCALCTQWLGVHALFGAVAAGLAMPRSAGVRQITWRIEGLTRWLLLPPFFVTVGLGVRLGSVRGWAGWLFCVALVAVAAGGKILGTAAVGRLMELRWRRAARLGVMMNCRGLTELVVLDAGRSAGLLSPALFTMLTIMALTTTVMTAPLLHVLGHPWGVGPPAEQPFPLMVVPDTEQRRLR